MFDVNAALVERCGDLAIRRAQEIPQEFLDSLAQSRFDSMLDRAGEMHRVCSIPVAIVETWAHQGFDIYTEPMTAIVARLKAEGLDYFLATSKAV